MQPQAENQTRLHVRGQLLETLGRAGVNPVYAQELVGRVEQQCYDDTRSAAGYQERCEQAGKQLHDQLVAMLGQRPIADPGNGQQGSYGNQERGGQQQPRLQSHPEWNGCPGALHPIPRGAPSNQPLAAMTAALGVGGSQAVEEHPSVHAAMQPLQPSIQQQQAVQFSGHKVPTSRFLLLERLDPTVPTLGPDEAMSALRPSQNTISLLPSVRIQPVVQVHHANGQPQRQTQSHHPVRPLYPPTMPGMTTAHTHGRPSTPAALRGAFASRTLVPTHQASNMLRRRASAPGREDAGSVLPRGDNDYKRLLQERGDDQEAFMMHMPRTVVAGTQPHGWDVSEVLNEHMQQQQELPPQQHQPLQQQQQQPLQDEVVPDPATGMAPTSNALEPHADPTHDADLRRFLVAPHGPRGDIQHRGGWVSDTGVEGVARASRRGQLPPLPRPPAPHTQAQVTPQQLHTQQHMDGEVVAAANDGHDTQMQQELEELRTQRHGQSEDQPIPAPPSRSRLFVALVHPHEMRVQASGQQPVMVQLMGLQQLEAPDRQQQPAVLPPPQQMEMRTGLEPGQGVMVRPRFVHAGSRPGQPPAGTVAAAADAPAPLSHDTWLASSAGSFRDEDDEDDEDDEEDDDDDDSDEDEDMTTDEGGTSDDASIQSPTQQQQQQLTTQPCYPLAPGEVDWAWSNPSTQPHMASPHLRFTPVHRQLQPAGSATPADPTLVNAHMSTLVPHQRESAQPPTTSNISGEMHSSGDSHVPRSFSQPAMMRLQSVDHMIMPMGTVPFSSSGRIISQPSGTLMPHETIQQPGVWTTFGHTGMCPTLLSNQQFIQAVTDDEALPMSAHLSGHSAAAMSTQQLDVAVHSTGHQSSGLFGRLGSADDRFLVPLQQPLSQTAFPHRTVPDTQPPNTGEGLSMPNLFGTSHLHPLGWQSQALPGPAHSFFDTTTAPTPAPQQTLHVRNSPFPFTFTAGAPTPPMPTPHLMRQHNATLGPWHSNPTPATTSQPSCTLSPTAAIAAQGTNQSQQPQPPVLSRNAPSADALLQQMSPHNPITIGSTSQATLPGTAARTNMGTATAAGACGQDAGLRSAAASTAGAAVPEIEAGRTTIAPEEGYALLFASATASTRGTALAARSMSMATVSGQVLSLTPASTTLTRTSMQQHRSTAADQGAVVAMPLTEQPSVQMDVELASTASPATGAAGAGWEDILPESPATTIPATSCKHPSGLSGLLGITSPSHTPPQAGAGPSCRANVGIKRTKTEQLELNSTLSSPQPPLSPPSAGLAPHVHAQCLAGIVGGDTACEEEDNPPRSSRPRLQAPFNSQ